MSSLVKNDLWTTDGTPGGTARVKAVDMSDCVITAMASAGDRYYYCQQRLGYENIYYLKISQGEVLNTSMVATLPAPVVAITGLGRDAIMLIQHSPAQLTLARASGEPFATQFEELHTFAEQEAPRATRPMVATSARAFFVIYPAAGGAQLWRTDGTASGTIPLCETQDDGPQHLIVFNDRLVFQADQKAKKAKPPKGRG